jgi:hypothetical protein
MLRTVYQRGSWVGSSGSKTLRRGMPDRSERPALRSIQCSALQQAVWAALDLYGRRVILSCVVHYRSSCMDLCETLEEDPSLVYLRLCQRQQTAQAEFDAAWKLMT